MKTILRINGTKQVLFQTVCNDVPVIKNENIKDYSDEYKKYYIDLAKSGDMVKIDFDYDLFSFTYDIEFGEINVLNNYTDVLYKRDFDRMVNTIKHAKRIEKAFNYSLVLNDEIILLQLLKAFKVQAVFIEMPQCKRTYTIKEAKQKLGFIFAAIHNSIITD